MELLNVTMNLGPSAHPAELESIVKAIRVASDIARTAEVERIRRLATLRFRFPTDQDLGSAARRWLNDGDDGLSNRASRLLEVRRRLRDEFGGLPPELWWREQSRPSHFSPSFLSGTGYERMFDSYPASWAGPASGLDFLEPDLYAAMVGDEVARMAPDDFTIRSIRYENPFSSEIAAADQAAGALVKMAGIIETVATLGARRTIARADAAVATATVDDRIQSSGLDTEIKRQDLRAKELANAIAAEELIGAQLRNASAYAALGAERQEIAAHLNRNGQIEEAEAVASLNPNDVSALRQFALYSPELERRHEEDPDAGD